MQQLKKKTEGFTIIEVMIVLVIAAVIILIVFLAVPALQRNSRNNQRKNDAGRVLVAGQEWQANNGNKTPMQCIPGLYCPDATDKNSIAANLGSLAFYDSNSLVVAGGSSATGNLVGNTTAESVADNNLVALVTDVKCNGGNNMTSSKGLAVIYGVETGNSNDLEPRCV